MHWRLTVLFFASAQLSEGCLPMVPPEEPVTPVVSIVCKISFQTSDIFYIIKTIFIVMEATILFFFKFYISHFKNKLP